MRYKLLSFILFTGLIIAAVTQAYAQGNPPPPPPPPPCWPPPCLAVPIDGGLGFLAAAAVAFGLKRLFDNRKSKG